MPNKNKQTKKGAKSSTKTKVKKVGTGKGASTSMKLKRLRALGLKDLRRETDIMSAIIRDLAKRKGVSVDMTKSILIKKHDTGSRLTRAIRVSKKDLSDMKKAKELFDRTYRMVWDAMDEFVRTSFMRDIVLSLIPGDMDKATYDVVENGMRVLSAIRMPTRMSGFNFNDGFEIGGFSTMQHPTSPGTGMWLTDLTGHSSAHNHLDAARVTAVIDALKEFINYDPKTDTYSPKAGVTLQTVISKMIVRAGTFTFRYFTHAATAANQTTVASVTQTERETQAKVREFMKDQVESFGASRATVAGLTAAAEKPGALLPSDPGKVKPTFKLDLTRIARPDLLDTDQLSPRRTTSPVKFSEIQDALAQ
ncbi:hypothetical protein [Dyella psychrodurans]|uniref:Uncharacterized protein n=1 Tax=Dyella psychrodurans TaxID=1927960 RepID=A0A370XCH6_9GAMM|nr:hypothetical protein [Dyella psychrodurans]RDS86108.1 hypothetical protein DWU99_02225 [Dyella psychrodurans]